MRILFLSNLYPPVVLGGYELQCANVARAMTGRGHDVRVLTTWCHLPAAPDAPTWVHCTLDLHWYVSHKSRNQIVEERDRHSAVCSAYANTLRLLEHLRDFRPDIVYAWNLTGIGSAAVLDLLNCVGVPWALHLGDRVPIDIFLNAPPVVLGLFDALGSRLYARARILTVSQRLLDEIEAVSGITFPQSADIVAGWADLSAAVPVIERTASPDGIAVDAGAYIGLHTVAMSRCFGAVHAFEPQREIFHVLCGNLALNGCANVVAHNLALYDQAGSMRLAPAERQEIPVPMLDGRPDYGRISNAAALSFEPASNEPGDVRAIALDELALDKVGLVKVDTQGSDLRVLQGATDTIRRCRPTVLFEWERDLCGHHGATLDECQAFFALLDYDVTLLHETSPGRQADYLATPR